MDQTIEPQTGELKNIFGDVPEQPPVATEYTLLDNGEYQAKLDILYPAGTVFYTKHPDGSYSETGTQPEEAPALPAEITEEFIIEKSTEFLVAHGYQVFAPDDERVSDVLKTNSGLKSQISSLKDQLAAVSKPVSSGEAAYDLGIAIGKLRTMVNSHMTHRAVIDEANAVIAKIESYL